MVNVDTSAAIAFVSENSPERHALRSVVNARGSIMVMTQTALREFEDIVQVIAGPLEFARAQRFLNRVLVTLDNPSARASRLRPTRNLEAADIMVLGTGDRLGIITLTADARAIGACRAQGVNLQVHLHKPVPLTGM
jgi:plasmid stabilization system protein ParE